MFILNSYRKFGIGSKLIYEFENWCKENQVKRMMVTASIDNESAQRFYRKNGFKNINVTLKKEL